jgi:hypothetical protein|tara:strand:+ start:3081 stop:3428 length:348 start_codon:yes stop_codon:yes gene_type:complete
MKLEKQRRQVVKVKTYFEECVEDIAIPNNWENVSHPGGDVCPSWAYNGYQIMIEHRNPELRELEGCRFVVFIEEEYGYGDKWLLETDSFDDVLKEIEIPTKTRPQSEMLAKDKEE